MADEYGTMDSNGHTMMLDNFDLECGKTLKNAEALYKTWGTLNAAGDNAAVICHALTGNADVASWWGELLGDGKPFDTSKYFVFCANVLGSCYGSTGPGSIDPGTGMRYGGDFPQVTIRDIVRMQAEVLKRLGVAGVAFVAGGSMGGMQALEWGICGYLPVRGVISCSASGRHHPWQIGISECQRQAIYADPLWRNGRYPPDAPPTNGMGVARMMAMLTYRTLPAYGTKFGRALTAQQEAFQVEQYLRYQADRFHRRGFDPAAYVSLTRSMDTHDLARGRGDYEEVLRSYTLPTLIVSISSDVLYPVTEQLELAEHMPNAQHHLIHSDEGHDGFLLEHKKVGTLVRGFVAGLEAPGDSARSAEPRLARRAPRERALVPAPTSKL